MSKKGCDFSKMGSRIIPKKTSDKEKTKNILEDKKRRAKQFNNWLYGGGNNNG